MVGDRCYRQHTLEQPSVPKTVSGLLGIWRNVGDPLPDMRSDYMIYAGVTTSVIVSRTAMLETKYEVFLSFSATQEIPDLLRNSKIHFQSQGSDSRMLLHKLVLTPSTQLYN